MTVSIERTTSEARGSGGDPARATRLRAARILSAVVLVLLAASSAAGVLIDDLYRDTAAVAERFRAADLVALVLAAPLLAISLLPSLRASVRAQLVWLSMLALCVYEYAFYVFGTTFNDVFLVHVGLFSSSVFALALALSSVDAAAIKRSFHARTPVRSIAGLLAFLGIPIGAVWIWYALRFAITDATPQESLLVSPIDSIHLAYVLDLSLIVPSYALAAVLLWRRAAWGYVLATMLLVSGVLEQLAYVAALVFQSRADVPGATSFDPGEVPIALAFAAAGATLLWCAGRRRSTPAGTPERTDRSH